MSSQRTERLTLLTDLHIKQDILSKVLSHVGLGAEASDNLLVTPPRSASDKKIYSFTYVPEYIETVLAHPGTWTKKYYPSVHGYAIDLQVYDQVVRATGISKDNLIKQMNHNQVCVYSHQNLDPYK